ncbi:hypothetical protein, partial [Streptomyces sp. Agncl-13]|uniref:hypothetical protein n=1 Tax=Streptomyces sp. Agncl-13 TaxID=3400628 RepID=UPI003A8B1369
YRPAPDIRAAVIATARVNMHRKMLRLAATGLFPIAVLVIGADAAIQKASDDGERSPQGLEGCGDGLDWMVTGFDGGTDKRPPALVAAREISRHEVVLRTELVVQGPLGHP